MNTNYSDNNHIVLVGKVTSDKRFSHEIYGEKFYIFDLSVPRLSGNADVIPVTVSERLLTIDELTIDKKIIVEGQFRSYNSYENERNRLVLTVFAKEVKFVENQDECACGAFADRDSAHKRLCEQMVSGTGRLAATGGDAWSGRRSGADGQRTADGRLFDEYCSEWVLPRQGF